MKNMNELLILPEKMDSGIRNFKQIIPITIYHFYLTDPIEEVDKYIDMIHVLKTAEQHDTIFIYLNTEGGYLKTAVQIMSAIRQSNATVITCLEGEVCSAGTMIFLAADKYLVSPNCTFMIHNYSGGVAGKGNEIAAQANYRGEYANQLMRDVYKDFLTEDEIKSVIEGKDMWLNSDQVIDRLGNKAKKATDLDVTKLVDKLPDLLQELIDEELDRDDGQPTQKAKPKTAKKKPPARTKSKK